MFKSVDNLVVNLLKITYNIYMEGLDKYFIKYQTKQKIPPHEQAAKVDEIIKIVGLNKIYNYTYWLRKVKNYSFSQILDICKEASNLGDKYNKGGFITNRLCNKKNTIN